MIRGRLAIRRLHAALALSLALHGAALAALWQGEAGPAAEASLGSESALSVALVVPGPAAQAVEASAAQSLASAVELSQSGQMAHKALPRSAAADERGAAAQRAAAQDRPEGRDGEPSSAPRARDLPLPALKPAGTPDAEAPAAHVRTTGEAVPFAAAPRPVTFETVSLRYDGSGPAGATLAERASVSGAGSASAPGYDVAGLDNPPPDYPELARRRGFEGRTVLRVEVSSAGRAVRVEIAESSGYALLDEAARAAVGRWRFAPAQRDGLAVAGSVEVPILFRLE